MPSRKPGNLEREVKRPQENEDRWLLNVDKREGNLPQNLHGVGTVTTCAELCSLNACGVVIPKKKKEGGGKKSPDAGPVPDHFPKTYLGENSGQTTQSHCRHKIHTFRCVWWKKGGEVS